jgi:hypothetical protein
MLKPELGNSLDSEFDDHHSWLVGVGGIEGVFQESLKMLPPTSNMA